jgi:hypothetical protein
VLSLPRPAVQELLERFYDGCFRGRVLTYPALAFLPLAPPAALHEARSWARRQSGQQVKRGWAGLVYFGVP